MAEKNSFKLNWRQAVVDVLLIVIGVSIALAADSWLGDRIEQARTDQLLDALEDEWATELGRIDAHLDVLNKGKIAIVQIIKAHDEGPENLSTEDAATLMRAYRWTTFKPSYGALSTLMVDGVQNIDDKALRVAVASWRTVLAELTAEQAALRELGTLKNRSIGARIAQNSGEIISGEPTEIDYWAYGMKSDTFALAAIKDDEWVSSQRHVLNLLHDYQSQLADVRDVLDRNLTLLRQRARN
jgi:hypothetical protein